MTAILLTSDARAGAPGRAMTPDLAGAVTGIGSLPFTSQTEAINTIAECCPEMPFWPQLPRLSEQETVIGQGVDVLKTSLEPRAEGYGYRVKDGQIDAVIATLRRSAGCLTSGNAAGFAAFEQALRGGRFCSARAIKGQIEGPVTLAAHLFYRDRSFLADETLFAAVAFHVSQIVCWQIRQLQAFGKPVVIFIDEPALCLASRVSGGIGQERRINALAAIFADIRSRDAIGGLHCCAARPFDRMCAACPDILSFDAYHGAEEFFTNRKACDFVESGGWVAYGIVPTAANPGGLQPAALFSRWLAAAALAGDPQLFAQRAMVTATCGLGLLEPASAAKSLRVTREVGGLLRELAAGNFEES